jgi:hypothetical protein
MKVQNIFLNIIIVVLIGYTNAFAQPGPIEDEIPIDGGASLLAAAGIAYGAKKIYDFRKEKNKSDEEL